MEIMVCCDNIVMILEMKATFHYNSVVSEKVSVNKIVSMVCTEYLCRFTGIILIKIHPVGSPKIVQ
jgi:hypothetical protein